MNKKRIALIVVAAVLTAILALTLAACNPYKWNSVGGGNPNAETYSNGGYFVRQGNYVYFVNGYSGTEGDNTFGTPYKQSIMRAEITVHEDGTYDVNNDTATVIVPKMIYNKYSKGGFAIYGEWIYYATPNNDADKSGTPSTTHTDFMRTKIDASVTQLIGTINSREAEYFFTPTRVVYHLDNDIRYFDFSGMKTDKNLNNRKGVTEGTLVEGVESFVWLYDDEYKVGQPAKATDYFFYTVSPKGDSESYKFYNTLYAMKFDGSDKKELISQKSYLTDAEKEAFDKDPAGESTYQEKVFNVKLINGVLESDGSITLYYTKNVHYNSTSADRGLYCNTFFIENGFGALIGENAKEKMLTRKAQTTLFPISYEKGALILNDGKYFLVDGNAASDEDTYSNIVIGKDASVWYVYGDYIYYTAKSSATELYRINLNVDTGEYPNESVVVSENIKIDWLSLEFDGRYFYYFTSDDYSYIHRIDILTFDDTAKDEDGNDPTGTLIGKMNSMDAEAKKKAEDEKNKENE